MTGPARSLRVARYTDADEAVWTAFVTSSRSGVFLFERPYMDYHRDRFADASLLVWDDGDGTRASELIALLPASQADGRVTSHGGLTFGGLVLSDKARQGRVHAIWQAVVGHYREAGFSELIVKCVPPYFRSPVGDDEAWPLWRCGAVTSRVDVNALVDLAAAPPLQERRLRSVKKAARSGVVVAESTEFAAYWAEVLEPVLHAQHGVKPVHSIDEIRLLHARYPDRIRLLAATLGGRIVAGTVLYDYRGVLHTQYLACADAGREAGALDAVIHSLVASPPASARFLSFGVSTEAAGTVLNGGLLDWKEGFGARAIPHETKALSLRSGT